MKPAATRRSPTLRTLLPILLALMLAPRPAALAGDAAPTVDAGVTTVSSARWPGDASGAVRAIVVDRGYEHVSSEVHVQWLQPDDAAGVPGWQVASSRMLVPAGLHHIDSTHWSSAGPHLRLALAGHRTYESGIEVRCVFELAPEGVARMLTPCGDD